MGFYVESADRPNQSRIAGSDVDVGEYVAINSSDEAVPFDGSSHTTADLAGVADNPRSGDQIVRDEDDTGGTTYLASEDDRVVYNGGADRDRIQVRTAEDTGGNEAAPSISDGDIVGFIDTSAGTLTSTGEYHGRIVEEGYDDGESSATTYNRSNSNFVPLGVAYRPTRDDSAVTSFDVPVRVEVRRDL